MGRRYHLIAPSGTNLRSGDFVAPEALSEVLKATVGFLQELEPPGSLLHTYTDWWEHDGVHDPQEDMDFYHLSQVVSSAQAVRAAMCGDLSVFVGIAPHDFRWYLRFYHDWGLGYKGGKEWCRFDITLPNNLISQYRQQVLAPLSFPVEEQESTSYYHSIGMGS